MKLISNYTEATLKPVEQLPAGFLLQQFSTVSKDVIDYVKKNILPGNSILLFSGHWQYSLGIPAIEFNYVKNMGLQCLDDTLYIDQLASNVLQSTLKGTSCSNLILLDSPVLKYLTIDETNSVLDAYLKLMPQGQLIASISMSFLKFNRLNMLESELAAQLQGTVVGKNIVTVRTKS